jgi:PAS domain S-box-containing protein
MLKPKPKHKIITVAMALGAMAWIIDTIFDYYFFYKPIGFIDLLFMHVPSHEIFIRSILFLMFVLFGLVIYRLMSKAEQSEGRYRQLFDNVNDGVFVTNRDPQGAVKFIEVNSVAVRNLGYSKDELLKLTPDDIMEPGVMLDKNKLGQQIRADKHILFETVIRSKDKTTIPVEVNSHMFDLAGKPAVLSIVRDITVRKQAEEKLLESEQQLKVLAAQLLSIQETERSRISKELHDELGQAMMLLKFRLSALRNNYVDEAMEQEFNQILRYFDKVIEDIRRLAKDLSPTVLENLGLSAAVRSLLEEFSKSLDLEESSDIEDVDDLLSSQVQLNIYRIFQEALTNIGRHAQARRVSSLMKRRDGRIFVEIRDDGKGFDVKDAFSNHPKTRSFGLATINERVRLIGGSLDLQSHAGAGTKISFSLPVSGE